MEMISVYGNDDNKDASKITPIIVTLILILLMISLLLRPTVIIMID